jgi:hypothetical protein
MKTSVYITVLICLFSVIRMDDGYSQASLEKGFINPPASAKARTWWHWLNGNVTREGLTADLEAMKRVGIQEAQIFNVDMGYPDGSIDYLSSEWLELFEFAALEAKRLGLELGFHNGPGWSATGGPWVTPEYSMQTVVYSETVCEGGKRMTAQLVQPDSRLDYYRDIAVLAFPQPKSNIKINDLEFKSLSGHTFRNHLEPDTKQVDPSAVIRRDDIIDLTPAMSADGLLEWDVPDGEWVVLRLGYTSTGVKNRPADKSRQGLECDKMNRKAVDAYWEKGIIPIIEKLGELVGPVLTNCLIDSYEVGNTNWTTGFEKEFKRLRGYDCISYLPALAGYYVDGGEITERFLWDFRLTIGDLISENYYTYFSELCHKYGMKFSVEPYWGPYNSMQAGETGDIVMCEFWTGDLVFFSSPRIAASIAHLNGNPIVGAEAFTGLGNWLKYPASIKERGDRVWTEGVNRFIYHTYTHQPWNVAPGVTLGSFGFELNRMNTWWEQAKTYMDYIARSQFLLQQGGNVADVLVFTGESSPNDAFLIPEIRTLGYDYDLIGPNKIASLSVRNGMICTPAGGKYRVLALPETTRMTPELLLKVGDLAKNGALIIGPKPSQSPSLRQYPQCDHQVARLAEELWDSGLIKDRSVTDVLKEDYFTPDFSYEAKTAEELHYIHRMTEDTDIYFVANSRKGSSERMCRFRVTGKQPEFWDSETGEIKDVAVWRENGDGTTSIPIRFGSEGSVFVVFRKPVATSGHLVETTMALKRPKEKPADLRIIKAEYGIFLPNGLADVTKSVSENVRDGKLNVHAGSRIAGDIDPAEGYIKELRIEYEEKGQRRETRALEGELVNIGTDAGDLKILKAIYGKFDNGIPDIPSIYPVYDVTEKITSMALSGILAIPVNDGLVPGISAQELMKELRITYIAGGETYRQTVPEGHYLDLSPDTPEPEIVSESGNVKWITPYPGKMTYTTSFGKTKTVQVKSVPEAVELTGSWEVSFPNRQGKPEKTTFDPLISWPASSNENIRYFSGTATYRKQFTLPKDLITEEYSLELDLGNVQVIAEVFVNGTRLGVLWRSPFRVDLDHYVHAGVNDLEVRVTNLWPNRLIGDEHLPEDYKCADRRIKEWPEWLVNPTERPSERVTFTTWKYWDKDSPLQPSGLTGPVTIRPYVHKLLK